jgi:predicted TIM-barrel fold metal-dependent hydrolase
MSINKMLCLACVALIAAAPWSVRANPAAQATTPLVAIGDYHMHLQGPELAAALSDLRAKKPALFTDYPEDAFHTRGVVEALAALDEAGIREGTLLSIAYMVASPMIGIAPADMDRITRKENQLTVDAALASHGRLQAFVSVNPLSPQAITELNYWKDRPGVSGLKLHLANSQFNPHSAADVQKLAAVAELAGRNSLPMVIHSRTSKEHGAAEERIIFEQVLAKLDDPVVQIAHCGTWGEVDQATIDTMTFYADLITKHAKGTRNLYFDLSGFILKNEPAKVAAFVAQMRRIGMTRFLMGSDWQVATPAKYYPLLVSQLPLTPGEWSVIFKNEAPYFRHPRLTTR